MKIPAADLAPEALAIGVLIGLLERSGDEVSLDTDFFEDPRDGLAAAPKRLGSLTEVLASSFGPLLSASPGVPEGAGWYPIPGGGGASPFCLVFPTGGAESGQIGIGAVFSAAAGAVTYDAFLYLPLVEYSPSGARLAVGDPAHPIEVGITASAAKGFAVSGKTFSAMTFAANLYLASSAYSTPPPDGFFTLEFKGMGSAPPLGTYHALTDLTDPTVIDYVGQVLVQSGDWLETCIGASPITVGGLLSGAGVLVPDDSGSWQFSLDGLIGQSAADVALAVVFGIVRVLAGGGGEIPYPLIEMPAGGLYCTARYNDDGSTDYGLRLALEVPVVEGPDAEGKPRTQVGLSLGSWLTGEEEGGGGWIGRSLGPSRASDAPPPGVAVYLLHQGASVTELSFSPAFALSSVGLSLSGEGEAPLLDVKGITLGGIELRAYLDEEAGWAFGGAARLDEIGIPLGPNFDEVTGSTTTNPVAQSLVASGSGGGDRQPVNPVLSASVAWVEGGSAAFQLYDANGQPAQQVVLAAQRSLGPLWLQRLAAGWVESTRELSLLLDAEVEVDVLSIDLTDLSIGIPVASPGDFSKYDLDLQGLGIEFEAGEVALSAALVKLPAEPSGSTPRPFTEYDGEALVKAGEFTITAVGSFAHSVASGDGYTSLFVFGVLDADLGGPPFFYVTGVAAGFGYNRGLLLPGMDSVTTYPLVEAASDPSKLGASRNPDGSWQMPDPAAALAHIDQYVPPQRGAYWLAAGVRFTSFDMVNSTALLAVEFGNQLEIALLGLSAISLPPPPTPGADAPAQRYAYAELGIEVKLVPSEGTFSATAVLTPSSFLLDPACKLTGGFAFYVWFGASEHAGQFVLTLGGYHPEFSPPSYFPQVPRLGFEWPMSGDVTVSGDAYFALTPSAFMVGGALQVLFASGDLKAWLTAHMDALIEWAPLHYEVDIGISVGVSYRLHLLFVTVTLKVELGAELTIWGPPTGGKVHVEWYVVSFTVGFGADRGDPPASLPWSNDAGTGFGQTLLPHSEPSPSEAVGAEAAPADAPSLPGILTVTPTGGVVSSLQVGTATVYVVRPAGFSFTVATAIPATKVELEAPSGGPAILEPRDTSLAIRPMAAILSSSALSVKAVFDDRANPEEVAFAEKFDYEPLLASVPAAKWGQPLAADAEPEMNQLLEGRLMGIREVTPKEPTLTPSGEEALSMDVETTFTFDPVDPTSREHLPLSPAAAAPQAVPTVDTATEEFSTVASTLMAGNVVTARTAVFEALGSLGVDARTNGDLTTYAGDPGAYLTDAPLLGAPA